MQRSGRHSNQHQMENSKHSTAFRFVNRHKVSGLFALFCWHFVDRCLNKTVINLRTEPRRPYELTNRNDGVLFISDIRYANKFWMTGWSVSWGFRTHSAMTLEHIFAKRRTASVR